MYDLGFPTVAIDAVSALYAKASTTIITPHGPTAEVPVRRGTVQGDTLSPFLFLIFIEPLLRWLQSGGRGYQMGCLPEKDRQLYACSGLAYADDLKLHTHEARDLQIQGDKVTLFCDWAHMSVNATKCAATAVLHHKAEQGLVGAAHTADAMRMVRNNLSCLRIQGQLIPILDADRQPYTYLGVDFTPTLNYRPYVKRVLSTLRHKLDCLNSSFATPEQRMRILNTCIIPGVTYAFPILPFSHGDIHRFDRMLVRAVKKAYGLPGYTSNAMIHTGLDKAGLDFPSLRVEYDKLNLSYLVKALNDTGPLGYTTRHLIQAQLATLGTIPADAVPHAARYLRLAKQHAMAGEIGLRITNNGSDISTPANKIYAALQRVTHYPRFLGTEAPEDAKAYYPLLEHGFSDLSEITCENGRYNRHTRPLKQVRTQSPQDLRRYVSIKTTPVNPDKDRKPTEAYDIVDITITALNGVRTQICEAYDPAGKYIETVTKDRLDYLYKQYCGNAERPTPDDFYTQVGAPPAKVPEWPQERQGRHQAQKPLGHAPKIHVSAENSPQTQHREICIPT
eukprot:jgi/Chrzof1/4803/UNPLg00807.t1